MPPYPFFQRNTVAKRVGGLDKGLEPSFDDGLVVIFHRFGRFNHSSRRGRRGRWRGWYRSGLRRRRARVADPSPLFLDIGDVFDPGCDGFQPVMDGSSLLFSNFRTTSQATYLLIIVANVYKPFPWLVISSGCKGVQSPIIANQFAELAVKC